MIFYKEDKISLLQVQPSIHDLLFRAVSCHFHLTGVVACVAEFVNNQ